MITTGSKLGRERLSRDRTVTAPDILLGANVDEQPVMMFWLGLVDSLGYNAQIEWFTSDHVLISEKF